MEDSPRKAQSVMHVRSSGFQSRASNMFKKVSGFREKLSTRRSNDGTSPYTTRGTRSMDMTRKPFASSQPTFAHTIDHDGDWSQSASPANSSVSREGLPKSSTPRLTPSQPQGGYTLPTPAGLPDIMVSEPSRPGSAVLSFAQTDPEPWGTQQKKSPMSKPPVVPIPPPTNSASNIHTYSSESHHTDSGYNSGGGDIVASHHASAIVLETPNRISAKSPERSTGTQTSGSPRHTRAAPPSQTEDGVAFPSSPSRTENGPLKGVSTSQEAIHQASSRKEGSGASTASTSSFVTAPATSRIRPPPPTRPIPPTVLVTVPMPPAETDDKHPGSGLRKGQGATRVINATLPTRTVSIAGIPGSQSSPRPGPPRPSLPPNSLTRFSIDGHSNRFSVDGSGRLSPSITTRHIPMPILHLPTLPPMTPSEPAGARSKSGLRSMPALPLQGSTRNDDPDHDHAGLEESDDDEFVDANGGTGEDGSDEDEDASPGSVGRPRRPGLPQVDISRIDVSFLSGQHAVGPSSAATKTPTPSDRFDYFSSKLPERDGSYSPMVTPRATNIIPPFSGIRVEPRAAPIVSTPGPSAMGGFNGIRVEPRIVPMPSTPGGLAARPSFYHQASKSMTDILSMAKTEKLVSAARAEEQELAWMKSQSTLKSQHSIKGKSKAADNDENIPPMPTGAAPAYDMLSMSHPLQRRRSMPTFNAATLPPPYPMFGPHPMSRNVLIMPREDEGKERLPIYSNSIYLQAIMPRKMEFSSPNVQATDRKWRRVLCVLEGTSFRVYSLNDKSILGWWESKVGAGDITADTASPARTDAKKANVVYERPAKLEADAGATTSLNVPGRPSAEVTGGSKDTGTLSQRSKRHLAANLLGGGSARAHSRSRSDAASEVSTSRSSPRGSFSISRPSLGAAPPSPRSSISSSRPASTANSSHFMPSSRASSTTEVEVPEKAELLKQYTLQNAESGLGNDYVKRKNVIRVRMEGEQFLLQAADVAAVVEWIEGFHAATNVALDLDLRVMPKPPMFPRRRRRRARVAATGAGVSAVPAAPSSTNELSRT